MIQSYAGEFTISPIPLEMSMNYCSHKCAYCFANLNMPGRTFDANGFINQIKNAKTGKSLTSYLINNKYPVLLSNRVDPFAETNWRQALTAIEMLRDNGNDIAFQTKGGKGIDEALKMINPSSWYISISMLEDEIRKKIEPGAPSIEERIKLIEILLNEGHTVSVGINPLVEDWLPSEDFENLLIRLKALSVKNLWIEGLHLNRKQVSRMSEKELKNVGEDIIDEACKRIRNTSYFNYCNEYAIDKGFTVFSMNQPMRSDYFDSYKKYKSLKTTQDFINHCFDTKKDGDEIRFGEYYEFMKANYYEMKFSECDGFAYRIARNVYKETVESPFKTLKDVLFWYWDNLGVSKGLHQNKLFQVLAFEEKKKIIPYLDKETKTIILTFNRNIKENLFNIVN